MNNDGQGLRALVKGMSWNCAHSLLICLRPVAGNAQFKFKGSQSHCRLNSMSFSAGESYFKQPKRVKLMDLNDEREREIDQQGQVDFGRSVNYYISYTMNRMI